MRGEIIIREPSEGDYSFGEVALPRKCGGYGVRYFRHDSQGRRKLLPIFSQGKLWGYNGYRPLTLDEVMERRAGQK